MTDLTIDFKKPHVTMDDAESILDLRDYLQGIVNDRRRSVEDCILIIQDATSSVRLTHEFCIINVEWNGLRISVG